MWTTQLHFACLRRSLSRETLQGRKLGLGVVLAGSAAHGKAHPPKPDLWSLEARRTRRSRALDPQSHVLDVSRNYCQPKLASSYYYQHPQQPVLCSGFSLMSSATYSSSYCTLDRSYCVNSRPRIRLQFLPRAWYMVALLFSSLPFTSPYCLSLSATNSGCHAFLPTVGPASRTSAENILDSYSCTLPTHTFFCVIQVD